MTKEEFEEYVMFDDDTEVMGELSEAELLDQVRQGEMPMDEDEDEEEAITKMNSKEKVQMLNSLRNFIQQKGMINPKFSDIEKEIYNDVSKANKQAKITDFFK